MPYERSPTQRRGRPPSRRLPTRAWGQGRAQGRETRRVEEGRTGPSPPAPEPTGGTARLHPQAGAGLPRAALARSPEQGKGRTQEQARGAGVRAVVDAGGVDPGRVEGGHQQRRGARYGERDEHQAAQAPAPGAKAYPEGEDGGPEQVELLLDRQRPQVPEERGAAHRLEVRLVAEDQVPVGDV